MSSEVTDRPPGSETGDGADAGTQGTPPLKDRELAAEQRFVDQAYVRLGEMREDARAMLREGFRQSLAGTKGSLVDRDAMVHQAAQRAHALDIADDGLVFGRLDLTPREYADEARPSGQAETQPSGRIVDGREVRYVGRIGVRTREHDSLVIDWRAPAAEDFYRATPEEPRGVIRRRVLHSRGHKVVDIEDDLLDPDASDGLSVVGDGAFLASLARTREGTMRDIVATIQREQDEVIRAPADGTVLVRGAPGTGKTAVALHRVAYLLFRHRRRFGSRGVLVVGPNARFTSYIERVLPSLGEGSATLRSLGDLVPGVTATAHDTPDLARLKGADAMVHVLRRAVTDHAPEAPDDLRVVYHGVVLRLDRGRLDKARAEVHRRARGSVNSARGRAADVLLDALWEAFGRVGGAQALEEDSGQGELALWNSILAADGLGELDTGGRPAARRGSREEFGTRIREQRAFTDFLQAWWPIRTPLDVLSALSDPSRLRRAAGRDLDRSALDALAASWASGVVTYQDVALLDELDAQLGTPPRPPRRRAPADGDPFVVDGVNVLTGEAVPDDDWEPGMDELTTSIERLERARRVDDGVVEERPEYAHIVVDEAQDLSPMQWRMLGRRGRQASWTVVEDPAQSAWEDLPAARAAMDAALGGEQPSRNRRGRGGRGRPAPRSARTVRHEYELTTNYRNSIEIAAVSARVLARALPEARPARAVRASGLDPVVRVVRAEDHLTSAREAAEELLAQVDGTIGLIVPMPSGDAWSAADRDALTDALPERVQVLDVLEAKGLEFDAAVIVAPETVASQSPRGLRVLYVAVSRATQRLTVLTADPGWRDLLLGV
ncbi:HelD family protein [Actinomadura harenae]|uniref:AAA family ATPase n=1 Tax=Actinomadura harenae TaxID=2483351 RepID=A0A3M2MDD0_9ACTN|nr:AAA family ATPase [Actinomadura harenae]RMI46990.1 AAA family ATPase [Actinomadura harenae]